MHNFWRAFKLTLKYKWSVLWVLVSSLCLALCWGGNIATVYPLVQVSFQGDSICDWLEKEVASQTERVENMRLEQNELLEERSRAGEKEFDSRRLDYLTSQIETSEKLLKRYAKWRPIIQRWTPDDPFLTVVLLMLFVLTTTAIKGVCTYVHSYLSSRMGQLGGFELRSLFFRRMLGYETTFFSQKGISDAASRFTSDMGQLTSGLTLVYGRALREPLKALVCLVGAAIVSWRLLLFTFVFVPFAALLIRWLAKSLKRVVRRAMAEMASMYGRVDETFRAIRVVKSFNRESYELAKFRRSNKAYFRRGLKTAKYDALTSPTTECLGVGMLVLAIMAGAYLIIYQETRLFGIPTSSRPFDLGSLVLFYGFLIGASDPARRLTDIFTNVQTACAAADRVYEVIDRDVRIKDATNSRRIKTLEKSIRFENVFYEYPVESGLSAPVVKRKRVRFEDVATEFFKKQARRLTSIWTPKAGANTTSEHSDESSATQRGNAPENEDRLVLKGVSLEIRVGETVAIVGRSGCGKSTLLSMIPRFIDPSGGRVLFDETPLQEIKTSDARDLIGLVAQDSVLFNDTVYENIRYGRPSATREEIVEAAKEAYADEFIREELSDGYDTIVGPGGGALSGGQRQRIALARALLKNPKIFLLDEATSQIDLQSERYIHQALKKFIGGRTTILVTHRLSAIQLADRVVVMQDGVVQFVGTHKEALNASPFYANLWASESLDDSDE